jgi:hypothetical protein
VVGGTALKSTSEFGDAQIGVELTLGVPWEKAYGYAQAVQINGVIYI